MSGYFEHANKPSDTTKDEEFLEPAAPVAASQ
jgi:hypothetical protein